MTRLAGSTDANDKAQGIRLTGFTTTHELLIEFASVVPHGQARRLIGRARRVAGLDHASQAESLETIQLLMILEAIASEGGDLQTRAEALARRTLYGDYDDTDGQA